MPPVTNDVLPPRVQEAMRVLGFGDLKRDEVRKVMDKIDDNGNGTVEFAEFLKMMAAMMGLEHCI